DQTAQRFLVVRIDREHVEADALGLRRVVEQPIALGLLHRVRDAVGRDLLERERAHEPELTPFDLCGLRGLGRGQAGPLVPGGGGVAAGAAAGSPASSLRVLVRTRMPNSLRPTIAIGS